MADQPSTPSGSRWESDPDETPTTEAPASESPMSVPPPVGPPGSEPVAPLDDPAAEERRSRLRGRAILAGAATALTLGGGLTGFVIGHSTAGNDNGFRPASFTGQAPGGEGQQGPPPFRGDGDGDGGSFGQPPQDLDGNGNGSSSNSSSGGSGTTGNPT